MDSNIEASLPEEERRRLHAEFDGAVLAVRREEAARMDEEPPHDHGDQPKGSAVQSTENPTNFPARTQQHEWATGPLPGMYRIISSIRLKVSDGMFKNGKEVQIDSTIAPPQTGDFLKRTRRGAARYEEGCYEKYIFTYVLVRAGLSTDDVGVAKGTVFQEIRPSAGFKTGDFVKKIGGATVE